PGRRPAAAGAAHRRSPARLAGRGRGPDRPRRCGRRGYGTEACYARGPPMTPPPVKKRTAAIVGIGQTAYAQPLPGTACDLAMEAVLAACADAGVDVAEVDGMCGFTAPFETVTEAQLVRGLGIRELSWFTQAAHGGEALGAVVMQAAAAVSAGLANTVV